MTGERMTPEEEVAFERILETFPGSEVGPFESDDDSEPGTPPDEGVLTEADEALSEADESLFNLVPDDWPRAAREGIAEPAFVLPPYLPRESVVLVVGAAESAKSMWAAWAAAQVVRGGGSAVLVSQENPYRVDVDRLSRLAPDLPADKLMLLNQKGLDLAEPAHFTELARVGFGSDVIFIDTLSESWSGDENSNADVVRLFRERARRLVTLTGASVVLVHHTGHPKEFITRKGVGAPRGASALGQKADVVLVFEAGLENTFTIEHAKNRVVGGGFKEPKTGHRVVDLEGNRLEIATEGHATDPRVAECMSTAVEAIASRGTVGTNELIRELRSRGFGATTIEATRLALLAQDPARVTQSAGRVTGSDGKQYPGKVWTLASAVQVLSGVPQAYPTAPHSGASGVPQASIDAGAPEPGLRPSDQSGVPHDEGSA